MNTDQVATQNISSSLQPQTDEIGQTYNPAMAGDGPAAKLWELLRRNPAFRDDIAWVLKHARNPVAKKKIIGFISANITDQNSITRPIAGYVLRWLAEPVFAEPESILRTLFGKDVAKIVRNDLGLAVFGPDMHGVDDACDPVEFMTSCPLYLLATPSLYLDEKRKLWMRLILPLSLKSAYPGPLRLSGGEFNLDTPWPQTPLMFRNQFSWLWANYDAKAFNPYTGDRRFLPGPVVVSSGVYGLQEQHDRLYPRLLNEFVFVVPAMFHTEQSVEHVFETFKSKLSGEFRALQVSAKKYQFLLGASNPWQAFSFVHKRVTYSPMEPRTPLMSVPVGYNRTGSGQAIVEFERAKKRRGDLGVGSKYKGHIEGWYQSMEDLMLAVYPGLNFKEVVSLLHPGWPTRIEIEMPTGR